MAKTKGAGRRAAPAKGRAKQMEEVQLTDSDAELDEFALGKDKISLTGGPGEGSEEELDEEAVYALDEDEDGSDEDDEEDLDAIIERGGKAASLAKQAKYLEQKLKLQAGEDEEGADEEQQEEGPGSRLWGANKRAYYDADTAEADDEEALKEEEAEVLRLQREQAGALRPSDYGLDDDEADDDQEEGTSDEDDEEDTMGAAAERAAKAGPAARPGAGAGADGVLQPQVEAVVKDLAGLTDEEKRGVLMADAPELVALLGELKGSLEEVRHRVGPLLREVRAGELATAEGLSYLEAKHLLLLQYSLCIVFYLMLKAEGRSVKDHPVIERLVELRAYLERIRPIDKQLQYQIDKLLRATAVAQASEQQQGAAATANGDAAAAGDADDALRYRPNPDALVPKAPMVGGMSGTGLGSGTGVYKPPKINPVVMEEDALTAREKRRLTEAQRKASRSSLVQELAAELAGAPEEQRFEEPGFDSAAAIRTRQRMEARAAVEEDLMTRVPLTKEEAKKLRAQRRAGMSGHGLLEDFADEVADLVEASGPGRAGDAGASDGLAGLFGRQRLSQKFGADFGAGGPKRPRSGDEEVPMRAPLSERRAKYDSLAARKAAAAGAGGGDDDDDEAAPAGKRRRGGEEDEFYAAARGARQGAKEARKLAHQAPALHPPLEDERVGDGRRGISTEIQKNRGLTPHRRKDMKNPRKKHRVKFAAAQVRRKGQVQPLQTPRATGYAGEATGIKKGIAKSTRLG